MLLQQFNSLCTVTFCDLGKLVKLKPDQQETDRNGLSSVTHCITSNETLELSKQMNDDPDISSDNPVKEATTDIREGRVDCLVI